jgi:hypothetical protein
MTDAYLAVTWPYKQGNYASPSLMAITATRDDTSITVLPTADTEASATVPALRAGRPASFLLHQGDVLELFSCSGDLSGTGVAAEFPVQVIAGHFCTYIPDTGCSGRRWVHGGAGAAACPETPRCVVTQDDTRLTRPAAGRPPPARAPRRENRPQRTARSVAQSEGRRARPTTRHGSGAVARPRPPLFN